MADKPDIRERFAWSSSKDRRKFSGDKLEVFEGRHTGMLNALVRSRCTNPSTAEAVINWTNTSRNLLAQIVRTCCVAYSRGCTRTLDDRIGETGSAAFASVVAESQIGALAPLINKYAWLLGPSFVLPQVDEDGTFYLDLISPSRSEVILQNPKVVKELLFQRASDGMFVRVDGDAYSFYDSDGLAMPKLAPVVHGLGAAPVAIFRSEHWTGNWWNASHRDLMEGALDVAVFEALLNYTRKNANKQLVIIAPPGTLAGKQIQGHPDAPLYFEGSKEQIDVKAVDMESSATTWLELIRAKTAGVCEQYGLPPSLQSGRNGVDDWGTVGVVRTPEVLEALRNEQVPWCELGEKQMWPQVCDLLRASNHPLKGSLPPGNEIKDALRLRYIEPIANIDHKLKRLELFEKQEKLGLASVIDLEIEDRPELTAEQATTNVEDRRALYLKRLNDLAKHNAPANGAAAVDSLAAAQGQTGGLTKAANEAAKAADENT